ncbi:MAG TPA: hypothetical protein VF215_14960 [Thermoanaerobaculia bacterium]
MAKGSNTRAAVLAAAMNLIPAAPVDVFRFLNVPAIVMTIRRMRGRICRDAHARHAHRRARVLTSRSSGS